MDFDVQKLHDYDNKYKAPEDNMELTLSALSWLSPPRMWTLLSTTPTAHREPGDAWMLSWVSAPGTRSSSPNEMST